MPSSHGGGSSGGSHGGGFSSSGGSSRSFSPNRPFPGARRYYYVDRYGVRRSFYSSLSPARRTLASLLAPLILTIAIVVLFFYFFISKGIIPHKMDATCNLTQYVYDNAGVIDDDSKLEALLERFYDKTGVQPVVLTEPFSSYSYEYGSVYSNANFENFAYNTYLDKFDDEGHWLFVYLHDSNDANNNHWIDMAGDNTNEVITDSLFNNLQGRIQSKFYYEQKSFEESFEYAFEYTIDEALTFDSQRKTMLVFVGIFALIFGGSIVGGFVGSIRQYKMTNEYCDYREKQNDGKDSIEDAMPASAYSQDKDYKTDEYGNRID